MHSEHTVPRPGSGVTPCSLDYHPKTAHLAQQALAGTGVTATEHLLAALSDILECRPHDTLFRITPHPGHGFGKVTCLEDACLAKKKIIILNSHCDVADGGKALGIGSLDYFTHHQRESPAHRRAVKARLKTNKDVRGEVRPYPSNVLAASTTAATSKCEKKRTLLEVSDGDDDIIILPTRKKAPLPSLKNTYHIEDLPILDQGRLVSTAASRSRLDKGKGRAIEDAAPLASSNGNNKTNESVKFGSNTAIPLVLQSASKRPRFSDPSSDFERAERDDISSSDRDDLLDVLSIYASKSKGKNTIVSPSEFVSTNPTNAKAERDRVGSVPSSTWDPRKRWTQYSKPALPSYDGSSAYDKFKALQRDGLSPASGSVGMAKALGGLNNQTMRKVELPVPSSSSSPAVGKGKGVSMDSGYLSSIDVTSSSSPASTSRNSVHSDFRLERPKGVYSSSNTASTSAGKPITSKHPPFSAKNETAPSTSTNTASTSAGSTVTKYPLTADKIRLLRTTETAITDARNEMGRLQRMMRKYGKRSTIYQNANRQYKQLESRIPKWQTTVQKLRTEASVPPAVPTASTSRGSIKPDTSAAVMPIPSTATPLPLVAQSTLAPEPTSWAMYNSQWSIHQIKSKELMNHYKYYSKCRDHVVALMAKLDAQQKRLYQPTYDNHDRRVTELKQQIRAHMANAPKMPRTVAQTSIAAVSAAQRTAVNMKPVPLSGAYGLPQAGSQAKANALYAKTKQYSDQLMYASGGGVSAYGDSQESLGYLITGSSNLFDWTPFPVRGPSTSAAGAGPRAGAYAGDIANLGPTHLPHIHIPSDTLKSKKGHSYLSDEDSEMPLWRRDPEDYPGLERVHTEEETLSFFKDAAAGYDFNEQGEKALEEAMNTIGLEAQGDKFPGTEIQPYAHQILGIAWMLNQEKVMTKLNGGILADDMGLGKTVQTISLIHLNQAKADDDEKATLVLAPIALLEQWKNEIQTHTGGRMKPYIYHGPGKRITRDALKEYDIVLTTPNTMALEWEMCDSAARSAAKRAAQKRGCDWTKEDEDEWYEKASEQTKPLFTINWRRIVIDEAQYIRNRHTKVSRACLYLNATYRWCLTGTPVTNTLTDIYSLLRFLKIDPWQNWTKWSDEIQRIEKKQPAKASKKVQAILKLVLLRRNKDSELNGKRLLNLKPMIVHDNPVLLSEDERNVYEYIEGKSQQQLSKYIREGTVMKNYAHVLVLLLRLRQCVGHPALVTESFLSSAYTQVEDPVADRAAAHQAIVTKFGQANLDSILKRRADLAKERFEDEKSQSDIQMEECPICMDPLDASALITPCGHTFCSCIRQWIELPETAAQNPTDFEESARACPNCRQKITKETLFTLKYFEPTKEQLAEITGTQIGNDEAEFEKDMAEFLRQKNIEAINKKSKKEGRVDSTRRPRAAKTRAAKRRTIKDSEDEDTFIDGSEEANPVAGYTKKTGGESDSEAEAECLESEVSSDTEAEDIEDGDVKDFLRTKKEEKNIQVAELSNDIKDKFERREGREFIPSAKMEAMVRIIREAPRDDKIMIISQWTSMLDLVSAYLMELGVPYLQFRGDMNRKERDIAVKRFNESKKAKCMLLSLKAGGVGLNMTGGNRAILLDLAWSPAVEAQASCRMHRLGQKKTVFVERCIVADTVEDRIFTLQDHKKKLADHSLGEGTGEKMHKFGIAELKSLFGMGDDRGHFASTWVHPDHVKSSDAPGPSSGTNTQEEAGMVRA